MRNRDVDHQIRELAGRQHGVVARRQLRHIGLAPAGITRRLDRGDLVALAPRVLRIGGAPDTPRSRLVAGMLEAGPEAVVSHASAAAVWRIPGFGSDPVHVTAARRTAKGGTYELATVHQPRCMLDWHWIDGDGLRVTTPTRTIFDLAGLPWVHPKRVERALDRLWAQGRVDHRSLSRMLRCLAARGRPGIVLMRFLIDARGEHYRPPESGAEGRFRELAASWGYAGFELQVDVGNEDRWIGRVDFIDRASRVVVEVDPAPFHTSLLDVAHDEQRRAALRLAGLQVCSVTERDLFHRPGELRRALSLAFAAAARAAAEHPDRRSG